MLASWLARAGGMLAPSMVQQQQHAARCLRRVVALCGPAGFVMRVLCCQSPSPKAFSWGVSPFAVLRLRLAVPCSYCCPSAAASPAGPVWNASLAVFSTVPADVLSLAVHAVAVAPVGLWACCQRIVC